MIVKEKEKYVKTYSYRGYDIDIYDDDYGQCYYFYFNDEQISCGTYNPFPEDVIEYVIDEFLDNVHAFGNDDGRFFGAYLRYVDHAHTTLALQFRGETLKEFDASEGVGIIIDKCLDMLKWLFENEEFKKMEEARKAKGNLYLNELMKKDVEN